MLFFCSRYQEARLHLFWTELGEAYTRCNESKRMQRVTETMLGERHKYPQLKCKANESKHLCVAMLDISREFASADAEFTDELRHCRRCFELLVRIFQIIDSNGFFLSAAASAELLDITEQYQQHYHWLFVTADARGEAQWLFTTKLHCLWHTMFFAQWLSPKASWTFSFEDFIGRLKASGRACVHGTSMHKVPAKLVQNYMIVLHLMLSEKAWRQRAPVHN